MAAADSLSQAPAKGPVHQFDARAHVLSGKIEEPIRHDIPEQASVKLYDDGYYQYQQAEPYKLKGILSYKSGYAQVAGHKSPKPGHGYVTLSTSVIEGLNVLEVVTADRVVAQIATEHPLFDDGDVRKHQVPTVSFLGTRFENLRIGGHKVDLDEDLDILGTPSEADSYFKNEEFLKKFDNQCDRVNKVVSIQDGASDKYQWDRAAVMAGNDLQCSIVNRVKNTPGDTFGHIVQVPQFGKIYLGELKVHREVSKDPKQRDSYTFSLTMIRLKLGCPGQGNTTAGSAEANGKGSGG